MSHLLFAVPLSDPSSHCSRRFDLAVAARLQRDEGLAVRGAGAGQPAVDPVVASLSELALDGLVAAVGSGRAAIRAQARAVGGRAVRSALVARLGRVLHDAVAAVAGERAVRVAGAVAAVVLAVVALLVAVLDAVAAVRREACTSGCTRRSRRCCWRRRGRTARRPRRCRRRRGACSAALHLSPVAPFSTPSSHCSPLADWTIESPQRGASAYAARHASAVAAVVLAVVADLGARDDAVAAGRRALRRRVSEAAEGQRVVRAAGVPLGLEEVDRVHPAVGEAERRRLGRIERDAPARRPVDAAEIDDELAVDEGPDVVVAGEVERRGGRGRRVGERIVELAREREVVRRHRVRAVHVRLRIGARVPAQAVERIERLGGELVDVQARALLRERERRRILLRSR